MPASRLGCYGRGGVQHSRTPDLIVRSRERDVAGSSDRGLREHRCVALPERDQTGVEPGPLSLDPAADRTDIGQGGTETSVVGGGHVERLHPLHRSRAIPRTIARVFVDNLLLSYTCLDSSVPRHRCQRWPGASVASAASISPPLVCRRYVGRVSNTEATQVFRVTVRGRFTELSDQSRAFLVRSQADHDIFQSAYTAEGTFTYDAAIAFFNLRYELRASGSDASELVELEALEEAGRFLATMGFGSKNLRASTVDMSAMTNSLRRTR